MDLAVKEILEAIGDLMIAEIGTVSYLLIIGSFMFVYLCYIMGSE